MLFHRPQKSFQGSTFDLLLYNKQLKRESCIKYRGIIIESTLKPIFILQKKAMITITFCQFDSPSSPLFKSLQVIKFYDLVTIYIARFM